MALVPMNAADGIWAATRASCMLDSDGRPLKDANNNPVPVNINTYPSAFATAYDDYAKAGVVSGAENVGGDKSIIENYFRNGGGYVTEFATMFARYWATVALIPAQGAVAVTNDAMSHIGDFEAAIRASLTNQRSTPYYYRFISNLENMAVKNIIWTVIYPESSSSENIN